MREIKFRGKRLDNGEWVYGSLIQYSRPETTPDIYDPETSQYLAVDSKTVGQSDDFRGQEYFDGDIAQFYRHNDATNKHEPDFVSEIWFHGGAFRYKGNYDHSWYPIHGLCNPGQSMKVIGNRHDNPELLEAKS